MNNLKYLVALISICSLISCIGDGGPTNPELEDARDRSTIILTSGSSKTWRIEQATLNNENLTIDISGNFNVVDDEFIFSVNSDGGDLVWRKGFEIKTDATYTEETLIDSYVSPVNTTYSFQQDSGNIVEADFGTCQFEITSDNTLNASITNADGTEFNFVMVEKTAEDYAEIPSGGLEFNQAFSFNSSSIVTHAPGMIGSYANNSFYLVTREDDLNNGMANPERIIKFNIETGEQSERLNFVGDFVSKQLHIIGEQLIVVGGRYINTYDIDLASEPNSTLHGLVLSRHGMAVINDDVYLIGGDLDAENEERQSNLVYKWNLSSNSLSQFAILPESKFGARGTIVHDNLYVFGGTEEFAASSASNSIYKINLNDPTDIQIFELNRNIHFTFVQSFENLIFVAGRIEISDSDNSRIGRESTIGVFNTFDNTYQELQTNLTNNSGFETIHQMCLFNGKMYIIYGDVGRESAGNLDEWDILVSDLN